MLSTGAGVTTAAGVAVPPAAASLASRQEGAHTICALPSNLRVLRAERWRCLPHRKHDMVLMPNALGDAKGEPGAFER